MPWPPVEGPTEPAFSAGILTPDVIRTCMEDIPWKSKANNTFFLGHTSKTADVIKVLQVLCSRSLRKPISDFSSSSTLMYQHQDFFTDVDGKLRGSGSG